MVHIMGATPQPPDDVLAVASPRLLSLLRGGNDGLQALLLEALPSSSLPSYQAPRARPPPAADDADDEDSAARNLLRRDAAARAHRIRMLREGRWTPPKRQTPRLPEIGTSSPRSNHSRSHASSSSSSPRVQQRLPLLDSRTRTSRSPPLQVRSFEAQRHNEAQRWRLNSTRNPNAQSSPGADDARERQERERAAQRRHKVEYTRMRRQRAAVVLQAGFRGMRGRASLRSTIDVK